jgi:hypothetical protein
MDRTVHPAALPGAALLLATACGLGPFEDAPGGRDNLPTRAAGPYQKLEIDFDTPADEPYVLYEGPAHYRDPAPLPRTGGGIRIWFTRQGIDSDEAAIWVAELPDIRELPDRAPAPALEADAAWEEGFVAEPSILDLGGGHLVLYYRGGVSVPAIGRADSVDGGSTWDKHPQNPVLTGAAGPAAAALPGGIALYHTSPARPGIQLAQSEDGVAFDILTEPVVEPRPGVAGAFDPLEVADPFALTTEPIDHTGAAQIHVGLFFAGARPGEDPGETIHAIGYAGSHGGEVFERFLGNDPILAGGPPSERGPAVLLVPAGGILFFHEARLNRDRIAAAVHP